MAIPHTDLLRDLDVRRAAEVLALGRPLTLAPGELLFRTGETAECLYLVRTGRIHLMLPLSIRGRGQEVLVEERLAGETVGWSGLVPPHRFTLNAVAPVAAEVVAFFRSELLEHFAAHPEVGYAVNRNVAAIIGHRLQVFQTMWTREMQRSVELRYS